MVFLAGNDTRRDLGCGGHLQVHEMKQQDRGNEVILRPSKLCVTHQVSRKKRKDQVGSIDTGWYLIVVGQYIWRCSLVLGDSGSVNVDSAWFLVLGNGRSTE